MKIIYLNITSYKGYAIGATHFYGSLSSRSPDYKNIRLEKEMTQEECDTLNLKDNCICYEPGCRSERFDSYSEIEQFAIDTWKTHFPDGDILIKGSSAVTDPQEILIAPGPFFTKGNELFKRAEYIGFWDYNETEMEKISKEWDALFDE